MSAASAPFELSADQVASFRERGFLVVPSITSASEVASLRDTLQQLFDRRAGWHEGAQFGLLGDADDGEASLTQLVQPVNYAPELRDTEFRRNAAAIAKQLLGDAAMPSFEHSILKRAHDGAATPWHQDEAYRASDAFEYEQLSIWMPLQDVSEEQGCMQYIPGSHRRGILPHHRVKGDQAAHSIECDRSTFDPQMAVACPLSAGGAVIHLGRTLHCAGANTTAVARLAYVLAFELPPQPATTPRDFHWNAGRASAELARRRRWLLRGGIVIEVVRRARYHELYRPRRLAFELRRLIDRVTALFPHRVVRRR
ncbi:MAG: phytanoyl-CoA dioxygenase family protein [Patulibacter sp.]